VDLQADDRLVLDGRHQERPPVASKPMACSSA
jgi:hypothetical protein